MATTFAGLDLAEFNDESQHVWRNESGCIRSAGRDSERPHGKSCVPQEITAMPTKCPRHPKWSRQEQTVKDLQESVEVSLMRYRGGTANYLNVLDSQRSLFQAELTLAQARNNEYQSLVQLYKALGGGWK